MRAGEPRAECVHRWQYQGSWSAADGANFGRRCQKCHTWEQVTKEGFMAAMRGTDG